LSIEVKNVTVGYYKDLVILHDISIHADESKITSIIGPNGAGKSTLLKTIYGFLRPKRGNILFEGKDITGVKPYGMPMMGIGYIPQERTVFPRLTVEENLKMGAWTFRKDHKRVDECINEVYERFPILKERRKVKSGKLSGGEQRMLEISRGTMIRPKAFLIDEPTAGLAPKVAMSIYKKLDEIREERVAILMVDQNVRMAAELSDYIYVLRLGRKVLEGPGEKLDKELKKQVKSWLV